MAKSQSQGNIDDIMAFFKRALIFGSAMTLCVIALFTIGDWTALLGAQEIALFNVMIWALPALAVLSISSGYLWGFRFNGVAALTDIGGVSGIALLISILVAVIDPQHQFTLLNFGHYFVAGAIVSASAFLVLAVLHWIGTTASAAGEQSIAPSAFSNTRLFFSGWPLMVISISIFATQAGSFAIGGLVLDNATLGLLRAAERIALLISFSLSAMDIFIGPRVAQHYSIHGIDGIGNVLKKVVTASFLISLPIALIVLIFGNHILALMGDQFQGATVFLIIMASAHLFHASVGSINMILMMAEREETVLGINLLVLVLGVIIFPLLSFKFGGLGFAVAYFFCFLIRDILFTIAAYQVMQLSEKNNGR